MGLTVTQINNAKAKGKPLKLSDGEGMYLLVNPGGGKLWKLKYRYGGREKKLSLGSYPEISLSEARDLRFEARRLLAKGVDPAETKAAAKRSKEGGDSFEAIAREWHQRHLHLWTEGHGKTTLARIEQNVFPWLGRMPVYHITPAKLLEVLRRMEDRGAIETAHRVRAICGAVFRYAIVTGRLERDPSNDLRGAIPPVKKQHFPTLTNPKDVGGLLRSIEAYEGSLPVKTALRLGPLLFVRPGELRHAEWTEFDLEKAEWRIPAHKMKMRVQHFVPLPKQAIALIEELRPLTGDGTNAKYLFPSIRSPARPISDNTIISALRRMGYEKEVIVPHGFRAMASTLLNEQGWNPDAIERQLAHAERDKVRASYNHAEYLPERRKMMQSWADYLDKLREQPHGDA